MLVNENIVTSTFTMIRTAMTKVLANAQVVCGKCCRHHGPIKVDQLQQFVADQLLKLPQVTAVTPQTIDKFLDSVAQHKVSALAFSTSAKASIPLRHAAQQHSQFVAAGRVQWKDEVTYSDLPSAQPTIHTVTLFVTIALIIKEIVLSSNWPYSQGLLQSECKDRFLTSLSLHQACPSVKRPHKHKLLYHCRYFRGPC